MAAEETTEVAEASGEETRQEKYENRDNSYTVMLNQDAFFGFYPTFNGLIGVHDKIYMSVYGILWTRSALGAGGTGANLWGEFGFGFSAALADDRLFIKPQIGITNGSLLSGGSNPGTDATGTLFLDGVVPSLTVNWAGDYSEAELYVGYYLAARQRNEDFANDFLHLWLNAGVKIFPAWSVGIHYEYLSNTRATANPGNTGAPVYQWIGAYTQVNLPKGFFTRFTAGGDIEDGRGDFYKIAVGMTF